MTIFIDITGFGMIIPLLPFYAETFNAGPTALGILVASFSMMQFVFSPILGKVSDNVGRKPVLLLSIMISALSFVFFALANSFLILLLSRIISGMATETAVAQAYIADTTSERERAKGIGRVGAAHGAGVIIGARNRRIPKRLRVLRAWLGCFCPGTSKPSLRIPFPARASSPHGSPHGNKIKTR